MPRLTQAKSRLVKDMQGSLSSGMFFRAIYAFVSCYCRCLTGIQNAFAEVLVLLCVASFAAGTWYFELADSLSSLMWYVLGLLAVLFSFLFLALCLFSPWWIYFTKTITLPGHKLVFTRPFTAEEIEEHDTYVKNISPVGRFDCGYQSFKRWQACCRNDPAWRVGSCPLECIADYDTFGDKPKRFWVVGNDNLYHERDCKGWKYFRCRILSPYNVNERVRTHLEAWEELRAEAIRIPCARRLAKELLNFSVFFLQELHSGSASSVTVGFRPPVRKRTAQKVLPDMTWHAVQAKYKPLLQHAKELTKKASEANLSRVQPLRLDSKQVDMELEDCVCCWCRHAVFVAEGCGHLLFCDACRRRSVAQRLSKTQPATLTNRQLQCTPVRCPMCRGVSFLVPRNLFEGRIFVS